MNRLPLLMLAASLLLACQPAAAQVNVNLPWIRATTQKSASVFMQLEAHAGAEVALTGAASPIAKSVKIIQVRGARRPQARLQVAPGSSLVLQPGAHHLQLLGLREPLVKGGHVPLTLTFEVPGAAPLMVDISAEVVGPHDKTAVDHEYEHSHQH
jgi:periplasmic copper chaperone A